MSDVPGKRVVEGPASPWKRVAAFFFDMLIIDFVLFFPFSAVMERMFFEAGAGINTSLAGLFRNLQPSPALIAASLSMALIAILYFALLEFRIQQTIGKMMFNLTVASSIPAQPLKFWQCLVRSLLLIPFFPFALLWVFDPLYSFFNASRQRLLEMMSRTRTVERYAI